MAAAGGRLFEKSMSPVCSHGWGVEGIVFGRAGGGLNRARQESRGFNVRKQGMLFD